MRVLGAFLLERNCLEDGSREAVNQMRRMARFYTLVICIHDALI
jgi:hypothetical protein